MPSPCMTFSSMRPSESARWKPHPDFGVDYVTCNSATRHGAVRATCRCVAVRVWLRVYIQQLSDAVAVDDVFKYVAVWQCVCGCAPMSRS